MLRTLRLGDHGEDVKAVQRALNARAKPRHYPALRADGDLGPLTWWAFHDLGWAIGLSDAALSEGITPRLQKVLADPSKRSPAEVESGLERRARMITRTIAFDGTPCFWGLGKPLQRARNRGWGGTLNSADRRKGVPERYGKMSQDKLYWCAQRKKRTGSCPCSSCNPANPPGKSSHELRSDGAAFPGPAGRELRWWELGLDCSSSDQLLSLLRELGYKARKPYTSASERHHVNFSVEPGPVVTPAGTPPPDASPSGAAPEVPDEVPSPEPPASSEGLGEPEATTPELAPAGAEEELLFEDEEFVGPPEGARAIQGIDVPIFQGEIDWKAVRAAGSTFAFVRATVGDDPKNNDKRFGADLLGAMNEAGVVRGFYHAASPSGGDAVREARHAVQTISGAGGLVHGDLPLALVLENTMLAPAATYEWVSDFCREVRELTGRGCILYTAPDFWRRHVGDPALHPEEGGVLWVAHYGARHPDVPRAWGHRGWSFWQYTDRGASRGISGPVALSHFYGKAEAFGALLI